MTKGEFIAALARRLGEARRHVERHVEAMHAAGVVTPTRGSRKFPPDITETEAVSILLGVIGAEKIEDAPAAAKRLANATDDAGRRLGDVLAAIFSGPPTSMGNFIVRPTGASIVINGRHAAFGTTGNGAARFLPGSALTALVAEFRGAEPYEADALAALTRIMK